MEIYKYNQSLSWYTRPKDPVAKTLAKQFPGSWEDYKKAFSKGYRGSMEEFVESTIQRKPILPEPKPERPVADQYQDYKQVQDIFEPRTQMYIEKEMGFDEGGRVRFGSGTQVVPINDETIEKFRYYIEETDLNKKAIGEKLGYKPTAKGVGGNIRKDSPIVKAYEAKYGKIPVDRFKEYRLNVKEGVGKRIVQAYDKQLKNFGKANISQIVKDVYGPGKKDFDGTRKNVRAFLSEVRGYEGKTNIPVGDENLSKEDLKSKARKKKLKLIDDTAIGKFMAGPKGSGLQYHHMDATKSSMVTLNNVVYAPSEVNNFIQKYEGPITQRKKEIAKLNKDKPKGYKKKIDTKLNQIRNTIAKADMDLKKAGYSAFQGIIEVDTVDVNGKPIKIGGGSSLRLGDGVIKELGLDPNKPLKEYTSEERIKLNEAKKSLVNRSLINIPKQPSRGGVTLGANLANVTPEMLDFRKLPGDVRHFADIAAKYGAKSPALLNALKKAKGAGKWTGAALAWEPAFALPFAAYGYKMGESPERLWGDATFGLLGETQQEELKKAVGERGYATQQLDNYGSTLKALENKYRSFNDQNDPRGEQRQIIENLYENTRGKYNDAYNMFVDDQGEFDKGKYDQALNNYTAGLVQIDKFKKQKQDERVEQAGGYENILQEREVRDIKGYASGGIASLRKK